MTQRPVFELQPYENETLPQGKRLSEKQDLVGHEIKAICDFPDGKLAHGNEMIIVTQTHCWLVLRPEAGYTCEEGADITTVRDHLAHKGGQEQLSDYLSAGEMHRLGLINSGEYALLKAQEDEHKKAQRQRTAEALRAKLAALES